MSAVEVVSAVDTVTTEPIGDRVDECGRILDATRVDWEAGGAFVTPPGKWHAHYYNESDVDAHLIPVQDAGLQTYLRTLDIRFTTRARMAATSD